METAELERYCSPLTALVVEDDPVSSMIVRKMLSPLFGKVVGAVNGVEGEMLFRELKPDLLITDLIMPEMDGIELLCRVRGMGSKTPVILMTSSLEYSNLVEAINLGVSKFLAKPISHKHLYQALLAVTREIHHDRLTQLAQRQEMELLRYRTRYHSQQEELAQAKERHISINQLQDLYLTSGDKPGGWLVDLLQQSRDVMSGDSYAVIKGGGERLLLYLTDAMGHGLSASVTSMLTTAFFNHVAMGCACHHLGFEHLCNATINFAARNLLEDETMSGLVLELDPAKERLRFIGCGLPPMLLIRNGKPERVRFCNPPVCSYSPPPRMQELDLAGVSDILLTTDGLVDAPLRAGGSYRDRLVDDLLGTSTVKGLFNRYSEHCDDNENDDDITIIRLIPVGGGEGRSFSLSAPGSMVGISRLQGEVRGLLVQAGASGEPLEDFELALTEGLMNALEHGCLGLKGEKSRLILEGGYDELLSASEGESGKEIFLYLTLQQRTDGFFAMVELVDQGDGGICTESKSETGGGKTPSGRGFMMMKRSADLVRRNQNGNRLALARHFVTELHGRIQ